MLHVFDRIIYKNYLISHAAIRKLNWQMCTLILNCHPPWHTAADQNGANRWFVKERVWDLVGVSSITHPTF